MPCTNIEHNTSDSTNSLNLVNEEPRKSTRIQNKPKYLQDYACTSKKHSWFNIVQYKNLPSNHQQIAILQDKFVEPNSYKEASKDPNWVIVVSKELDALAKNNTWKIVDLHKGKRLLEANGSTRSN